MYLCACPLDALDNISLSQCLACGVGNAAPVIVLSMARYAHYCLSGSLTLHSHSAVIVRVHPCDRTIPVGLVSDLLHWHAGSIQYFFYVAAG